MRITNNGVSISFESFIKELNNRIYFRKMGVKQIKVYKIEKVSFSNNSLICNGKTYLIPVFIDKVMNYRAIYISNPSILKRWKGWDRVVLDDKIYLSNIRVLLDKLFITGQRTDEELYYDKEDIELYNHLYKAYMILLHERY